MKGHFERHEKVLHIMAVVCLLLGFFCAAFVVEVRFFCCLLIGAAAAFLLAERLNCWSKKSRRGRICKAIFLCGVTAFFLSFFTVETWIYSKGQQKNESLPADAVFVLGAGVNGTTPSVVLQSRIDTAAEYLKKWPKVPAILSGGRGPGEQISEAECIRRGLIAKGIDAARLTLEDQSTSTAENMVYSKSKLGELGLDPNTARVAVVTSDFHCLRAHLLAERTGLTTMDISAKINQPLLNANYYVREFFALGKSLLLDNELEKKS